MSILYSLKSLLIRNITYRLGNNVLARKGGPRRAVSKRTGRAEFYSAHVMDVGAKIWQERITSVKDLKPTRDR